MKNNRLMRRLHRMRSKRGLSLIELVVGVTILVIVFGGTMSAMANGYTDTLYNASENVDAAKGAAVNEIVMTTLQNKQFANESEFNEYFFNHAPNASNTNNVFQAAAKTVAGGTVHYTAKVNFPDAAWPIQYTIVSNSSSTVGTKTVSGMEVWSAVKTVKGWVINKSFVPYAEQS